MDESSVSRESLSQLLADAIPAESLPAGSSSISAWEYASGENVDMAVELKDNAQTLDDEDNSFWGHSYFLSAPYMVTHQLFEHINQRIKQGGTQ